MAEQTTLPPSQDPMNLAAYDPPIERKFTLEPLSATDKYSAARFQGVLVDTGAAGYSTAGVEQFKALQRLRPGLKLDRKRANECRVKGIGDGVFSSLGAVDIQTPIGMVTFHVVPCNIPFLLSLKDMDRLHCTADTQINSMVQHGKVKARLLRKYGHIWMTLGHFDSLFIYKETGPVICFLTDQEIRQLHRRFGHPSVNRFYKVLQRAGKDVKHSTLERLTKFCRECQLHGGTPQRHKFVLRKDAEFNHTIYVDVVTLEDGPVMHVVDEATGFAAAEFLSDDKSFSALEAWNAILRCWICVYTGPPDHLVHDAGTNFASAEFRKHTSSMNVDITEVPVEAANSIGKVERAHGPLRRAYQILKRELAGQDVDRNTLLKMAIKACNDTAGPDGIVPTLCVFGAYPRMTWMDGPAPTAARRAESVRKAMEFIRKDHSKRQVQDALRMRNGPKSGHMLDVPIGSKVLVWRKHMKKWTGPWQMVDVDKETVTVQVGNRQVKFRATIVKRFWEEKDQKEEERDVDRGEIQPEKEDPPASQQSPEDKNDDEDVGDTIEVKLPTDEIQQSQPMDEDHDDYQAPSEPQPDPQFQPRRSQRLGRFADKHIPDHWIGTADHWITEKEKDAIELSREMRKKGLIVAPGEPFQASTTKEVEGLLAKGVFEFLPWDITMTGKRIFDSRVVKDVKDKHTLTPYEKSRLVVQAFNDAGKQMVLTQSPTVQRSSTRLMLSIAVALIRTFSLCVFLRDISQAYVQSTTPLIREVLCRPAPELVKFMNLPTETIMRVLKPLYGIPEAGNHWFGTYIRHLKEKLSMEQSAHDPCLLITKAGNPFGVTGMQVDDTLFLGSEEFVKIEDRELKKAGFEAKDTIRLTTKKGLIFNGTRISLRDGKLSIQPNNQGSAIELIDLRDPNFRTAYRQQRARGAYVATTCQPLVAFALSVAAQHQDPGEPEVKAVNVPLKWQKVNPEKGLVYCDIDMNDLKMFVWIDGSFANNKDLSSQIGFVVTIGNEISGNKQFTFRGNIVHWSSTKCKRITRAVLASELYAMVQGVDIAIPLCTSLNQITAQLDLPTVPIVVCTDSFSLYECLVKLGTTKEKRLMIDIMALRESYERRELAEIRWVNGNDNPADAMTKANPNKALQTLIDGNELTVRLEGWVDRA